MRDRGDDIVTKAHDTVPPLPYTIHSYPLYHGCATLLPHNQITRELLRVTKRRQHIGRNVGVPLDKEPIERLARSAFRTVLLRPFQKQAPSSPASASISRSCA